MKPIPLLEDLQALRASTHLSDAARATIDHAYFAPAPSAAMLIGAALAAGFGVFKALALATKGDAQQHRPPPAWQPWVQGHKWFELLEPFDDRPPLDRLEVLLREQWALGCHVIGIDALDALATRYERSIVLLDAAPPDDQQGFLADKNEWLRQEFELACLTDLRHQTVDEMQRARVSFLLL